MRACLTLITLIAAGCGGTPLPRAATDADLRSLTPSEAVEIIEAVLTEARFTPVRGEELDVGGDGPLAVDVCLGDTPFAIEWVSAQDRTDQGAALPDPAPDGQLRILAGRRGDTEVQVLVLEHSSYRYDPDAERVRRGSTGPREAESRLRRDVGDFLEHVRNHGL